MLVTLRKWGHHCAELQPVLIPSLSQINRFWMNLHCKGLSVSFTRLEQINVVCHSFQREKVPGEVEVRIFNMNFIQEPRVHMQVLCLNLSKVALCARTGSIRCKPLGVSFSNQVEALVHLARMSKGPLCVEGKSVNQLETSKVYLARLVMRQRMQHGGMLQAGMRMC